MKKYFAIAVLLLAALGFSLNVKAQSGTTYQIQPGLVDPIDYGSYWNIFASDMYVVLADGDPYYISVSVHVASDDTFGQDGTTHNINFWNLKTNVRVDEPLVGHITDSETHPARNGPQILYTTLDGAFTGQFSGTIHVPIYGQYVCGRFCSVSYVQKGSTVTIQ
jgi:hypothetical protein